MIREPGSSRKYLTGDWRSKRPECDEEKCTNCLICWIYCPDNSHHREGRQENGIQTYTLQGLRHLRAPNVPQRPSS